MENKLRKIRKTEYFIFKCNTNTKSEIIAMRLLDPLLHYNFNKADFIVFLTDGAAFCKKFGNMLKALYDCYYVVCVCHNIHNSCEYIRKGQWFNFFFKASINP